MKKLTPDRRNVIAKAVMDFSSIKNTNGEIAGALTFSHSIIFSSSLSSTVASIIDQCSERMQGFLELIELLINNEYETTKFKDFCSLLDKTVGLHTITWKDLAELRKICIDGGIIESDSEMEKAFEEMMPSDYVKKESYPSEARLLDLLAYHSQSHVQDLLEFVERIFFLDPQFTSTKLNDWKAKIVQKAGTSAEEIGRKIMPSNQPSKNLTEKTTKNSSSDNPSEGSLKLSNELYEELTQALLAAFPAKQKLTQMLRFGLGKYLDRITTDGNLQNTVFELIEEAESQEWLMELIKAARKGNPGNTDLKNVEARIIRYTQS